MYNQADRCDRTAYVSGLQNSITDIELFEFFNKVAHVEKVILRSGTARHALVVFKSVEGLYKALVEFNKCYLHGRQLHIRPLRESSHANNEMINVVCEHASRHNRRPSTQERYCPPPNNTYSQNVMQNRAYVGGARNPVNPSFGRRKLSNSRNHFQTESYGSSANGVNFPQFVGFNTDHIPFEDYSEGAQRFDNLANVVRSCQQYDPFLNRILKENPLYPPVEQSRSRSNSTKESSSHKTVPPTWKMELQIKKNDGPDPAEMMKEQLPYIQPGKISPQDFIAKFASINQSQNQQSVVGDKGKKKRPNLSVINPSLFYEQYPRTSSPVTHQVEGCRFTPRFPETVENPQSPHDPAVLAYRRLRAPTTFDGVSPIDPNNCSFVTKHLGAVPENVAKLPLPRHEMTNEELSDMIVSTGNLRINPTIASHFSEPAPWSPVKRLRAESGSLSMAQLASPQFSPINLKCTDFNETEDEVFNTENNCVKKDSVVLAANKRRMDRVSTNNNVLTEQKLPNFEDINNSRLPSNSHSANPNSVNREFSFPPHHICRHTSVPSLTNFVGDMSDSSSPHLTAGVKYGMEDTSVFTDYQSSSVGKSWDMSMARNMNGNYQGGEHAAFENMVLKP